MIQKKRPAPSPAATRGARVLPQAMKFVALAPIIHTRFGSLLIHHPAWP
jgi:hypothetical protein